MKLNYTGWGKIISIVICAIMVLSFSACGREIIDSGSCGLNGDNVSWELYDDGALVISGTGAMEDYKYHEHTPWFMRYHNSIKSVTIGDNVTTVGDFAFSNCYYLSSVTLSDSVTNIGDYSFGDCESLS